MASVSERLNQRQVAELLRLTTRQIHNLVEKGMPSHSDDGVVFYLWNEVLSWYIDFKVEVATYRDDPSDIGEAEKRLKVAQAKKAEMEVAILEERYLSREEALGEVAPALDNLRSGLLSFTPKHAHELVGLKTIAEVTAKLEPSIHGLMRLLSIQEAA